MVENRRITAKDVYLKLLQLEVQMDTTGKDIHCDINSLKSYFSKWLWVMAVLNAFQIILFVFLIQQ